jgi:hypothetical protein
MDCKYDGCELGFNVQKEFGGTPIRSQGGYVGYIKGPGVASLLRRMYGRIQNDGFTDGPLDGSKDTLNAPQINVTLKEKHTPKNAGESVILSLNGLFARDSDYEDAFCLGFTRNGKTTEDAIDCTGCQYLRKK